MNTEKFDEVVKYFNRKIRENNLSVEFDEVYEENKGEITILYGLGNEQSHNEDYTISFDIVYVDLFDDNHYDTIKEIPLVKEGLEKIISKSFSGENRAIVLGKLSLSGAYLPSDFQVWFKDDRITTYANEHFEQVSTNPDYESFIQRHNMEPGDDARNVIDFMINSYLHGLEFQKDD
jgi:hypothetical protein